LTAERIVAQGGYLRLGQRVTDVEMDSDLASRKLISSVTLENGAQIKAKSFLFTPSFEICSSILGPALTDTEAENFKKVQYLGNICLVLQMKRSLSDTYWLNVNDPGFPFVGVIEHTNLDQPESFDGSHIAYLSRYIDVKDPDWKLLDHEYFEMALDKLVEMFPSLEPGDIISYKIWRSRFAQPIAGLNYSTYLPGHKTSIENSFFFNMAQIYPEDRGTNYAIREGGEAADQISYYLQHMKGVR
jgi:protoporphyrinogen oxidase